MIIEPEVIRNAKEKLGDKNAELIAELLDLEDYNEKTKKSRCPNPNHDDSTPSFSYNPRTFSFHCFGCGYNVDLLEAYMRSKKVSFLDACEFLFDQAGIRYDFGAKGAYRSGYYYPKPHYADNKNKVYAYWASRGISKETIDYMGVEQDTDGNTLFQYWDLNDTLVSVKVRVSGKVEKAKKVRKCWHLSDDDGKPFDHRNILYNINKINTSQPLIITSGEGDCLAAIECGFYNSTSINGGDQNTEWIGECWDFLSQFDEIILVHDNDESGKKFAKEVSVRLGEYRIKIAEIPESIEFDGKKRFVKDLNEYLFYAGKQAVCEVINNARESEIPSVIDYTDVKKFDMSDVDGFYTGFAELDKTLDKLYMGTTTIITGIASSGKSSLISTLACRSVEQGFPAFIYSGELPNPSLKNWIDCVHAGQFGMKEYINTQTGEPYYRVDSQAYDRINRFYKDKIFFYRDGFGHKTSTVLKTMEAMVRKRSVKTLILDNMTSLDLENNDNNKYIKQEDFIRDIIDFSKRWQVACIVVLHPRKMEEMRRMTLFDLQGAVAAVNLAHRVLSLYRVSAKDKEGVRGRNGEWIKEPIKYDVILDVLKDRFGSATGASVGLYYDKPSRRFFDSYETLAHRYAWDKGTETALPFGAPQLEDEMEVFGTI